MRTDVVKAARAWIDTPYRHQHSTKGRGCDCLGLVRGVWRDVVGPEPERAPSYSPSWGEGSVVDHLVDAASRNMTRVPVSDMQPGDVLILRMLPTAPAKHCAIYSGDGKMIHAYQGANRVVEHSMADWWRRKIVGVFRFPEKV